MAFLPHPYPLPLGEGATPSALVPNHPVGLRHFCLYLLPFAFLPLSQRTRAGVRENGTLVSPLTCRPQRLGVEVQPVPLRLPRGQHLQPLEPPNPMLEVHHVIPFLQFAEINVHRGPRRNRVRRLHASGPLHLVTPEDLRIRHDDQLRRLAQEAAREGAEVDRGGMGSVECGMGNGERGGSGSVSPGGAWELSRGQSRMAAAPGV